jgi:CheY-like chemotaxis protein
MSAKRPSLTVLVAEDDADDRGLIKRAWTRNRNNSALRFVEDGEELMDYLNHLGKYTDPASAPRPGVILLDLNMPKKDGREALREIKGNPKLRQIPVIILTTSQAEEDICRSYDLGANSYITKPSTYTGLVEVLQVLVKYWIHVVDLHLLADQQISMEAISAPGA